MAHGWGLSTASLRAHRGGHDPAARGLMRDNPLSKIPTLALDDGTVIYDSPVICEYLDRLHAVDAIPGAVPRADDGLALAGARRRLFRFPAAVAKRAGARASFTSPPGTYADRRRPTLLALDEEAGCSQLTPFYRAYRDRLRALLPRLSVCRRRPARGAPADCGLACDLCDAALGARDRTGRRPLEHDPRKSGNRFSEKDHAHTSAALSAPAFRSISRSCMIYRTDHAPCPATARTSCCHGCRLPTTSGPRLSTRSFTSR